LALSDSKIKKAFIIIISVFAGIIIIVGAIWGVRSYLYTKEQQRILEEKNQKIAQEEKNYSAPNFEDKNSNYIKLPEDKEVAPGQIINFEIFYKNTGLTAAKDFNVSVIIPVNCKIVKENLKDYSYKLDNNSITFKIGDLDINKSGSLNISFKVASPLDNGTAISVPDVKFSYSKEAPFINKSGNFQYEIKSEDKLVVKSSPDFDNSEILIEGAKDNINNISSGDAIVYKLYISNKGDMDAKNIEITVTNLDNLVISQDENKDFTLSANTASLKLSELTAGGVKSFYLQTKVNSNAENNSVVAPVMEIKFGDNILKRESPESIVKLYPSFGKSVVKIAARGGNGVYSGDVVDITVSVTNSGKIEANNVIAKLVLSNLFVLDQGQLSWNIPKLAIGQTASFNTSLRIVENITKDTYATVKLNISSDETSSAAGSSAKILVSGERPFTSGLIPIVAIHGIEPNPSGSYELSTAEFEYLCGTLNALGYKTITFMDLLNYLDKGKRLPEKPVIITSDDGYYDVYAYAFPILQKYGYKMTVFLVTGLIGNSDADRHINEFDQGKSGIPTRPMLIWPEISAMSRYGIEFLSHTVSHKTLGDLTDQEALYEMSQSKIDIESHLKKPVPFIAWPFDNYSSIDVSFLSQAGYRGAVLYHGGIENVNSINIYAIKRVRFLSNTSTADYAALLGLH
jgi:peptidoglycan/xylan/chitin deacetylase (PgdA/CDA1 family)